MLATYNLKYSYTEEALCLLTHTKGIRSVHLHKNYTLDSISIWNNILLYICFPVITLYFKTIPTL